jgi:Ca-activated chloride channel family protein
MSNHDEFDDKLSALNALRTPAPNEARRNQALDAAMLAFDAEQKRATQGNPLINRLRSVFANAKGNWTMDNRLTYGLGTAAIALLLLPLGYQLYTSTAITPIGVPPVTVTTPAEPNALGGDAGRVATKEKKDALANTTALNQPAPVEESAMATANVPLSVDAGTDAELSNRTVTLQPDGTIAGDNDALQSAPADAMLADTAVADKPAAPAPMMRTLGGNQGQMSAGVQPKMAMESFAAPASVAEPMMATPTDPSGDEFSKFTESPVKIVKNEPVSTFSIDVDTAAYAYVRRMLEGGSVPEPDAVRIEELINYFSYNYPAATDAATPFKPTVSVYPTPWNSKTQIVQIGIKGYVPPVTEDKPSNLVFLLDTSGSMDEPDKLPLLKRAFGLLVDQLGENDTVSIVAYAGSAGVVLEPTKGSDKTKILAALDNLSAGGSTAGAEGIELAYRLAEQHKVADGVNRVILATDGDFNVGIDDPEDLKTYIKQKRDSGVFLSVLGFGQGNLGDDTMQALAQNGNGNASYIDSFKEAQKVLVQDAGGTLNTIAKDVKIQVEFNPGVVSEYRLIGYETRALNREDFNNDKVDAGDIGAGTTVTALYEITPVGSGAELNDPLRYETDAAAPDAGKATEFGFLKMRYKLPNEDTSKLIEVPISKDLAVTNLDAANADDRWAAAVAAFGQKLKGSNYGEMSWADIRKLAQGARGEDEAGYRAEFMGLIDLATSLQPNAEPVTPVVEESTPPPMPVPSVN